MNTFLLTGVFSKKNLKRARAGILMDYVDSERIHDLSTDQYILYLDKITGESYFYQERIVPSSDGFAIEFKQSHGVPAHFNIMNLHSSRTLFFEEEGTVHSSEAFPSKSAVTREVKLRKIHGEVVDYKTYKEHYNFLRGNNFRYFSQKLNSKSYQK